MRPRLCSVPLNGSFSCLPPPLQARWRVDLHFMEWESTESQLFHTVRGSHRKGRSCSCPPGTIQFLWVCREVVHSKGSLLPAGPAGLARGGTEPPQSLHSTDLGSNWQPGSAGADRWYNCAHVAIANQGAGFLPARTHTAAAAGAVRGVPGLAAVLRARQCAANPRPGEGRRPAGFMSGR